MNRRLLLAAAAAALLAGCGALPDKPVREIEYDFGPHPGAETPGTPAGAPITLHDIEAVGALEGPALLYRLAYADANELRPYAYARWSAPPAQLLRLRLREHLGRTRPVLDGTAAATLARRGGKVPAVLRVELEEFSQVFDSATSSQGVLRLRCTLLESTAGGERLLAQRSFRVQRPAPSADAAGGVKALAAAADAAAAEIAAWLQQPR